MKSKTLLVTYLPALDQSNTAKLVGAFLDAAKDKTDVTQINLLEQKPDFFLPAELAAYKKRHYMGQELKSDEQKVLAGMDAMTQAVIDADHIVMAFPMHNFSLPALVKAFFDAVLLKGKTWDTGPNGFVGLLKNKSALVLTSSGGIYEGDFAAWNHCAPLAMQLLGFMGITDAQSVTAPKMNMTHGAEAEAILKTACAQITEITNKRFSA